MGKLMIIKFQKKIKDMKIFPQDRKFLSVHDLLTIEVLKRKMLMGRHVGGFMFLVDRWKVEL